MNEEKRHRRFTNIFVVIVNSVLIIGLIIAFGLYDSDYKARLYDQNIEDISNVNQASASIASTFFSGREAKLRDLALHIEEGELNLTETLDFIYSTNSDETKFFEIIGPDYTGYRIEKDKKGKYIEIDYTSGYGNICSMFEKNSLQKNNQVINFAHEFTDAYAAVKSFALYNCVKLRGEDGKIIPYTLMVVSKSADFINQINIDSGYEELSTAIINKKGEYIIGNSDFKSDNFFKFVAVFNDMSLDEQNELARKMIDSQKGYLSYLDERGRQSVFVYTPVHNMEWFCIAKVPTEYFHNGKGEFLLSLIMVIGILILLMVDILYLAFINRRLKISVENEHSARVAKTDFLARMSHDMRTPMNGIIGMTRLTQNIPGLTDEVRENLDAISDSSGYLLQLINDTLDMNKIESGKFTLSPNSVNVAELIEHIISTVKVLAEQKNIELEFITINEKLQYIMADRMRLQQIFMNILSNAVKFTPNNGKVHMEVECLKLENDIAYDRISIEDTGCGMSEEYLEHIYEPFSQEQTRIVRGQEGTGLGMAIVKNLVEQMGGKIQIESKVGVGTKVTVYLNFARSDAPKKTTQLDNKQQTHLRGKRALLVEDHPLNAMIAERLLINKEMLVEVAENGLVALKMFSSSELHYYDVILMDIRMPEMNGIEASKEIRKLDREDAKSVPILAMTANAYAEDVQAALDAGMNEHLAKPIEPEILYRSLEKYI